MRSWSSFEQWRLANLVVVLANGCGFSGGATGLGAFVWWFWWWESCLIVGIWMLEEGDSASCSSRCRRLLDCRGVTVGCGGKGFKIWGFLSFLFFTFLGKQWWSFGLMDFDRWIWSLGKLCKLHISLWHQLTEEVSGNMNDRVNKIRYHFTTQLSQLN